MQFELDELDSCIFNIEKSLQRLKRLKQQLAEESKIDQFPVLIESHPETKKILSSLIAKNVIVVSETVLQEVFQEVQTRYNLSEWLNILPTFYKRVPLFYKKEPVDTRVFIDWDVYQNHYPELEQLVQYSNDYTFDLVLIVPNINKVGPKIRTNCDTHIYVKSKLVIEQFDDS